MKINDIIRTPGWMGRPPLLTDSELICLGVAQVLLGACSEAHWLRYARTYLRPGFPRPATAAGLQPAHRSSDH